jgi:hypothetical protein
MRVVDRIPVDLSCRRHREDVGKPHRAGLQRRRRRDDLVHRARLPQVGHGAVPEGRRIEVAEPVRVEPRVAGHRVDVAGARIHHDDRAAGGAVVLHRPPEVLLRLVLDLAVDGQHDVVAFDGWFDDVEAARDQLAER